MFKHWKINRSGWIGLYAIIGFFVTETVSGKQFDSDTLGLKEAFQSAFRMGVAVNSQQISQQDKEAVELIKIHFNALVPENCMKIQPLQPKEGVFHFQEADRFVAFGNEYGMHLTGHTLIWHSQIPDWFFTDSLGNEVTKEVLIERMRNHITTVVSRYKGQIAGWDVVNEAVNDDGTLRQSKFLKIIGEDYIPLAFAFAHAADPEAELYYNDYSMALPAKREGVVKVVQKLQEKGIPIHAVGMQGHLSMHFPSVEEFERSILAFANLGVAVMITELDLSILPEPGLRTGADLARKDEYKKVEDPYTHGVPPEKEQEWQDRYLQFFNLFLSHADKISRVTLWGVTDGDSWRNNFPVRGRTDYPLLFDRNYQKKPLVKELLKLTENLNGQSLTED